MNRFLAIDFETANGYRDSACALGIALVEDMRIAFSKEYLICPSMYYGDSDADDFDFRFTHVHGISWTHVAYKPDFGELWEEIRDFFENLDFLAAHNAPFDMAVLKACCECYDVEYSPPRHVCTMKLARNIWSIYPTDLRNVCKRLGIELEHHRAESDAVACANIIMEWKKGREISD